MALDASFFALVALVIFFGIVIWLKVPAMAGRHLDARAERIRGELDEARRLREEAQELLAEFQRKRKAAEAEAQEIIAAARHEAELFTTEAARRTEELVARRTAMAEQKIAQAEAQALADVKSTAVDIAIAAAEKVIGEKVTGDAAEALIRKGLAEVRSRMQ